MPHPYTLLIAVIFVLMLALIASSQKAHSASVTICKPISTTIQLPKPGKCRTYSLGGYSVKVCG